MEINGLLTNGIPDNFEALTPEELKEYRVMYGYYLSPTTILRLLEPRAYFAGLIWELEELLKDEHHYLKRGYNYHSKDNAYSINNSNMQPEQIRLSEKFELNMIKQLFVQHKGNKTVSDRELHVYNTLEPINSPVTDVQNTDAVQTFLSFNSQQNRQSVQTGVDGNEVTNHEDEQNSAENGAYQNNLENHKEALEQGTQHGNCSDTHNTFHNIDCAISTDKMSSGFDNKCDEYMYKNKSIDHTEENEYTDSLSQDTAVKVEQQNFNNNSDKGSQISLVFYNKDDINGSGSPDENAQTDVPYVIQEIYQTPLVCLNVAT